MLIVRASGDERIVVALRAELASYRFNVLEIALRGAAQKAPLAGLADDYEAQAVLRAQPEKFAVEVFVASEGAEAKHDELVTIEAGQRFELLATRVIETMRARGLRLPAPPEPARPPASAEAPVKPAPRPQPSAAGAPAELSQPTAAGAGAQGEAPATTPPVEAPVKPKPAEESPPAAPKPKEPAPKPSAEATPPKPKPKPAPHVNPVVKTKPAEPAAPPPRDTAADSGEDDGPVTSRNALLFVELSPAGVFYPGAPGLDPSFNIWADVRLQPYATTSLSAFALAPLAQAPVESMGSSAAVRMFAIGGAADFHVPIDPLAFSVGMGAASLLTSIKPSTNNAQYEIKNTPQRTMAFFVRAGGSYQLASVLRLTARVMIGIAVPELRIKFVEEQVASWGHPLVVATLGLELALPWHR